MHQRVSGHTARLIVKALAAGSGRKIPELAAELGLPRELLADRETSLTKATMDELWDRALVLSGDDGFGLSLATVLAPGTLGAVEYLFRNMRTLGEAYRQVVRFQNLLQQNTSRWSAVQVADDWAFGYELIPPIAAAHRHIVEFAFASFVALGRHVASSSWVPAEVSFAHSRGAKLARYRDAFGAVPLFDQKSNEIRLTRATCAIDVAGADGHLANIVREYAERQQSELSRVSIADQVRRTVTETMHRGEVTLKSVAKHLQMNERALRRRLSEDNASFQALVDEVRFDVARAYVDQNRLSTAEIALLLGFSEVGALYRAFRRWSGTSLSDYRASQSNK